MFIDGLDEVTGFFEGTDDIAEAVHRVNTEADVVWVDGHSDYGHALGVFWDNYADDVGPSPMRPYVAMTRCFDCCGRFVFCYRGSSDS